MAHKTTAPIDYWPDDWIKDTRELTCAAKGFWHDACMFMLVDKSDRLTHTPAEFGRKMGCGTAAAKKIIAELERHKTCDVVRESLTVSILSRRYKANVEKRNLNARYQLEHRVRERKEKVSETQGRPSVQLRTSPKTPTASTAKEEGTALVVSQDETTREDAEPKQDSKTAWAFTALAIAWNACPPDQTRRLRSTEVSHPANRDRLRRLKSAMKDDPAWVETATAAIEAIQAGHCAGWFGKNDRGWKPTFDFIFERGKLGKILDGAYAPTEGAQTKTGLMHPLPPHLRG